MKKVKRPKYANLLGLDIFNQFNVCTKQIIEHVRIINFSYPLKEEIQQRKSYSLLSDEEYYEILLLKGGVEFFLRTIQQYEYSSGKMKLTEDHDLNLYENIYFNFTEESTKFYPLNLDEFISTFKTKNTIKLLVLNDPYDLENLKIMIGRNCDIDGFIIKKTKPARHFKIWLKNKTMIEFVFDNYLPQDRMEIFLPKDYDIKNEYNIIQNNKIVSWYVDNKLNILT